MPVIAIVGAAPGMGLAIARTFGEHGYTVALLSRSPAKLEPVVAELARHGVEAAAFAADVLNSASIASGLAEVRRRFGRIDVLEFSSADRALALTSAAGLTHDEVEFVLDACLTGAVAAVRQVLPDMLARRSGTILVTTGAAPIYPQLGYDRVDTFAPAAAALREWAHALHAAAAPEGVQVAHVAINSFVGRGSGATPDAIAPLYWELHTERDQIERVFVPGRASCLPDPERRADR